MLVSPQLLIATMIVIAILIVANEHEKHKEPKPTYRELMMREHPDILKSGLRPNVYNDGWTIYWSANSFAMSEQQARSLTATILLTGIRVEKNEVDEMLELETRENVIQMIKSWPIRER